MHWLSLLPFALVSGVNAWNADVHQQIAFLAEEILATYPEPTLPILAQLLEPEYEGSIGRAAGWADDYKDTPEGKHSYIWHWITAKDRAPDYCNLYYWRDCGKAGCVVSAIEEQTAILTECVANVQKEAMAAQNSKQEIMSEDASVNATCSHALKWVVHFLGDVSQPLHASGRAFGGNLEKVTFGGETVRLHQAWDRYIIYHDADVTSFSNMSIDPFFEHILELLVNDELMESRSEWLKCDDPLKAPKARQCGMAWARESNQWNCDYVYGREDWNTTDMKTGGYSKDAFPIVEMQVAKSALRLSQWLFRIVHPFAEMKSEDYFQHLMTGYAARSRQQEL